MCKQDQQLKAYGAGILSSVDELKYCLTASARYFPLDVYDVAENHLKYPISTFQPYYFVAESFSQAKRRIAEYCAKIEKPFSVSYDTVNNTVCVDRDIIMEQDQL